MIGAFLSVCLLGAALLGPVSGAASSTGGVFAAHSPITVSPAGSGDQLGYSVAVSGDTVVVGAPFRTINGHGTRGEVLVFVKPKGGWTHARPTAVLTASDGSPRSVLGMAVGISGRTIVASEPYRQVGHNPGQGVIYVFTEPKGGWHSETQTAELRAADGGPRDLLGLSTGSLAISRDTVVAGAVGRINTSANGAAYVFSEPSGRWRNGTQTAELTSGSGDMDQAFGSAVSIGGNTIAVGAPGTAVRGGTVYVFRRPGAGWRNATPNAALTAGRDTANNELGDRVAVSRQTIVAAARLHHRVANDDRNVLYVFAKPLSGWADATQTAILNETNSREGDDLGRSLAIDGNTILAGDPSHELTPNYSPGAAYLFARPARGWRNAVETRMLAPAGSADNEGFGAAVAMSGSTIAAGAPNYSSSTRHGRGQGRLYVISLNGDATRTMPK